MGQRFSIKYENRSMARGIRTRTEETGTTVLWFHFDPERTEEERGEDLYDWGEDGRYWEAPFRLPVYSAIRMEGSYSRTDLGFYTTDDFRLTVSLDILHRYGMDDMVENHTKYLRDRFVFRDNVYSPTSIQIQGQVRQTNNIVAVNANEVSYEELTTDPEFSRWAVHRSRRDMG